MGTITPARNADWVERARELAGAFGKRAGEHGDSDRFVAEDYADLRSARMFSAAVPAELGGGGASYAELCAMVLEIAKRSGSTALAFSMHAHLVATAVWRWRHQQGQEEPLLRRIAADELVLVGSGASDWLNGSGRLEKVEGGYRLGALKLFASGSPAGDLLVTSGVWDESAEGPAVLHFAVPLDGAGVRRLDTWYVLGMRGTGSDDVLLENVFVPDSAIGVRRPRGRWHPLMHVIATVALPVVYSTYAGLAEAARDLAVRLVRDREATPDVLQLVGEMDTELAATRIAHRRAVEIGQGAVADEDTTNEVTAMRTLIGRSAIRTVEKAMEAVGGAAYYRGTGLERIFRDVQAARYHPLQEKPRARYAGRRALGLPVDE